MTWLRVNTNDFNMEILDAYSELIRAQQHSSLTYLQRQMIFVVVSNANKCRY